MSAPGDGSEANAGQPTLIPPQLQADKPGSRPSVITTETIDQLLTENARLIVAIIDNQNAGRLEKCVKYQTILQQNLMYLAAVADAQPAPNPSHAPVVSHQQQQQEQQQQQQHEQPQVYASGQGHMPAAAAAAQLPQGPPA